MSETYGSIFLTRVKIRMNDPDERVAIRGPKALPFPPGLRGPCAQLLLAMEGRAWGTWRCHTGPGGCVLGLP